MAVGRRTVIPLVFQGRARRIGHLPPGATAPHAVQDLAFGHPQGGAPADVLDRGRAHLPGCDPSAPPLDVRRLEGDVLEQAPPLHQPGGAVGPCLPGAAPSVLRGLDLLAQSGLSAVLPPAARVESGVWQGLHGRGRGTQPVCGDQARQVGRSLAQRGHKALGGLTCASMLVRPIPLDQRLRHARHDGPLVRRDERSAQQLVRRGDGPVAGHPVYT
jgi:hypothetical protein